MRRRFMLVVFGGAIAAAVIKSWPDMARYLKIRAM